MVENVKSLGFYSRLFLVPKPNQRWRPVIDLNRLNTFLLVQRFKMETPESIRASLIPGKWVLSIDLADAHLHIPFHPNSRKYPRKVMSQAASVSIHFLSFWTSHGPSVLYNNFKRGETDGESRGIRLQYLDDWLIRALVVGLPA